MTTKYPEVIILETNPQEEVHTIQPENPTRGWKALVKSKKCLYYTIFCGVLAALVAVCLWVFFQTIMTSLIGTKPGLSFRPLPPVDQAESPLIWYKGNKDDKNLNYFTNSLDEFLEVYKTPGLTPGRGQNINECGYNKPPQKGQVCNVDVKNWKPCVKENFYNYHRSSPCIFLTLNTVYGWVPEYYNSSNLPENMPVYLKEYIANINNTEPQKLNTIWVTCEGVNAADIENIGPINYIPNRGFPGYFYPYENSEGYLSPLVAIQLERPMKGIIISIECKAWARNIKHDGHDKLGSVDFELLID